MKNLKLHLCVLLFIFVMTAFVNAQTFEATHIVKTNEDAHCELNNLYIDLIVTETIKNKERVFVISRLGKNEKDRWNLSRLALARTILTQIKPLQSEQVVTAVGEKSTETNGRLEFYVGSQLFLVSYAEKNKQPCLLCCDTP